MVAASHPLDGPEARAEVAVIDAVVVGVVVASGVVGAMVGATGASSALEGDEHAPKTAATAKTATDNRNRCTVGTYPAPHRPLGSDCADATP
jgi:hypothetical protein